MPNQPRTPLRGVRIPPTLWDAASAAAAEESTTFSDLVRESLAVRVEDGLWWAAKAIAAERGETVSDVIRRALERYVRR